LLEARMVLGAVGGAMHAHHIGQFEWRWSIFDGELAADFGGDGWTAHGYSIASSRESGRGRGRSRVPMVMHPSVG
jgi:hypothetical protein